MIRRLDNNKDDILECSKMLMNMYNELQPFHSSKDLYIYIKMINQYLENSIVLIDNKYRGMFIMRDESVIALDYKIWNGIAVYIYPKFRNKGILKEMYKYMFKNFNGVIMGFTEKNSEHNKVLMKRYKLLGYVYQLRGIL